METRRNLQGAKKCKESHTAIKQRKAMIAKATPMTLFEIILNDGGISMHVRKNEKSWWQ